MLTLSIPSRICCFCTIVNSAVLIGSFRDWNKFMSLQLHSCFMCINQSTWYWSDIQTACNGVKNIRVSSSRVPGTSLSKADISACVCFFVQTCIRGVYASLWCLERHCKQKALLINLCLFTFCCTGVKKGLVPGKRTVPVPCPLGFVCVCVFLTSTCSSLAVAVWSWVGTVHSRVFPTTVRLSQLWLETVRTWHFIASLSIRSPYGSGANKRRETGRITNKEEQRTGTNEERT